MGLLSLLHVGIWASMPISVEKLVDRQSRNGWLYGKGLCPSRKRSGV
jgi:hypothetical protein